MLVFITIRVKFVIPRFEDILFSLKQIAYETNYCRPQNCGIQKKQLENLKKILSLPTFVKKRQLHYVHTAAHKAIH